MFEVIINLRIVGGIILNEEWLLFIIFWNDITDVVLFRTFIFNYRWIDYFLYPWSHFADTFWMLP